MTNTLCVLGLTTILAIFVDAQIPQYCNLMSCRQRPHTLCIYPFLRTNRRCGSVEVASLNHNEIQDLLDTHNRLRARVASGQETRGRPGPQPAATNLGPLVWNPELAAIAQTWANQCDFNHDKCRNTASFVVGQNVGYFATTGHNRERVGRLVNDWYDEVRLFDRNGVRSYVHSDATGHYTQVVWAETTQLGCGAVRYNNDGRWNKLHLVCNYGPSGNWRGEPIYKTR